MIPLRAHIICGPTASGKDDLGYALACKLNQPVIVMDSMKVYRHMDIGTDKPELQKLTSADYHLVNIREPHESYDISTYLRECDSIVRNFNKEGKTPVIAGGTFLYLKALLHGIFEAPSADEALRAQLKQEIEINGLNAVHQRLASIDPAAGTRIHANDEKRIIRALEVYHITGIPISDQQQQQQRRCEADYNLIPLTMERQTLYDKINARVHTMFEMGLLEEVQHILEGKGFSPEALSGVGYRQVVDHLKGEYDYKRMVELIQLKTRRFAKHQMTWMRNLGLSPVQRSITVSAQQYADTLLGSCKEYESRS